MKLRIFTKQNAGSIALLIMVGCGKTIDATNDSMVKSQAKPDRIVCYSYSAKDSGYALLSFEVLTSNGIAEIRIDNRPFPKQFSSLAYGNADTTFSDWYNSNLQEMKSRLESNRSYRKTVLNNYLEALPFVSFQRFGYAATSGTINGRIWFLDKDLWEKRPREQMKTFPLEATCGIPGDMANKARNAVLQEITDALTHSAAEECYRSIPHSDGSTLCLDRPEGEVIWGGS